MTEANELTAQAGAILDANGFMTLATADESGMPWASPVWTSDQVQAPARHRLFRAVASEHVVLSPRDERIQAGLDA